MLLFLQETQLICNVTQKGMKMSGKNISFVSIITINARHLVFSFGLKLW